MPALCLAFLDGVAVGAHGEAALLLAGEGCNEPGQVYKKVMAGEKPRNLRRVKDLGALGAVEDHSWSDNGPVKLCGITPTPITVRMDSTITASVRVLSAAHRQDELLRGIIMQCARAARHLVE